MDLSDGIVNFSNLYNLYRICFHLRELDKINFIVHHIIYEKYIYMYIQSLQIF